MELTIDGINCFEYGATALKCEYTSGNLTASVVKGSYGTAMHYYGTKQATGSLKVSLFVNGFNRAEVNEKIEAITAALFGMHELYYDGYVYKTVQSKIGKIERPNSYTAMIEYTFTASKHRERVQRIGNYIKCDSTVEKTDCKITVIASEAATNYAVGCLTVDEVKAGDVIVIDGESGKITINDIPSAHRCTFYELPTLKPGMNEIFCRDIVTVGFYPTFL